MIEQTASETSAATTVERVVQRPVVADSIPWREVTIPGEPEAFYEGETLVIARCAAWRA